MFIDDEQKEDLEANDISLGVNIDLYVKRFNSHDDIMDYVGSNKYMQDKDNEGLCFGFAIEEPVEDDIKLKMVFSAFF
jgi:hypothetical protein